MFLRKSTLGSSVKTMSFMTSSSCMTMSPTNCCSMIVCTLMADKIAFKYVMPKVFDMTTINLLPKGTACSSTMSKTSFSMASFRKSSMTARTSSYSSMSPMRCMTS